MCTVPRKMVHAFTILSVVRGYHKYKDIWSAPIDGTELSCEREMGNPRAGYIGRSGC